ncbi:MAG: ABC transporter permease [Janthinobacterium lividum]
MNARASLSRASLARTADSGVLILVGVLVWAAVSAWVGPHVLTGPFATLAYLGRLLPDPDFHAAAWETLRAFALAFLIAASAGLAIGILLGANRVSGAVAEPILTTLYSVPKITLYPVILLFFGLGISARVAFGAIHGVVPVILFTMAAVRGIRPVHFRTAHAMGLSPVARACRIVLPACLPGIVSGLRVGFSLTLLGTLIGEMFASQRGLGRMTITAMENDNTQLLIALALLLFVIATLAGWLLLALDRHLHRFA